MLSARLPDEFADETVLCGQRHSVGFTRPDAFAALIPPYLDAAATRFLWKAQRALLPPPVSISLLARSALVQHQLGWPAAITSEHLNDSALMEQAVQQAWAQYARQVDADAVMVGVQVMSNDCYDTKGVAAWMRDLVPRKPAVAAVAQRFVTTLTNHKECIEAVALHLAGVWKAGAGSHPVCVDLGLTFDADFQASDRPAAVIAIYHEFQALELHSLRNSDPAVVQCIRQALNGINKHLRPLGLPPDYVDLFGCWREEDMYEAEAIAEWMAEHGLNEDSHTDLEEFFAQAETGDFAYSLSYIECPEQFGFIRNLDKTMCEIRNDWSAEAMQQTIVLDPDTLRSADAALWHWCQRVATLISSYEVTFETLCEGSYIGMSLPILLPEMVDMEDEIQQYYESYLNGGDLEDEHVLILSPRLTLAEAETLIERMACGTRLLAELYDLTDKVTK
jgi:hypothetical protein